MKFHFALLGVLCAHAVGRDKHKELKAATATSTNVTWNDAVLNTYVKSDLFGTCIAAANTRKMQYFLIQDPANEIEFVKYEVNRLEKGLRPVKWEKEIQCNDILDCARASKAYYMFQYNGTTCRMANVTYIDSFGSFCDSHEGYEKDVVYINSAFPPSGCSANTDVIVGDNGTMCVGGFHQDVPFDDWTFLSSCEIHYGGRLYTGSDSVNLTTIQNYLRNNKYQGEFVIDTWYNRYSDVFKWADDSIVDISNFAVKPQEPYFQALVVISSSHDYLLRAVQVKEMTGFLCLGNSM